MNDAQSASTRAKRCRQSHGAPLNQFRIGRVPYSLRQTTAPPTRGTLLAANPASMTATNDNLPMQDNDYPQRKQNGRFAKLLLPKSQCRNHCRDKPSRTENLSTSHPRREIGYGLCRHRFQPHQRRPVPIGTASPAVRSRSQILPSSHKLIVPHPAPVLHFLYAKRHRRFTRRGRGDGLLHSRNLRESEYSSTGRCRGPSRIGSLRKSPRRHRR